jgi:tetratricopeptide (TPR) repeat protein
MARRKKKLNIPLISTLLVIALLIIAGTTVVLYKKFWDHKSAEHYIARGDELAAEGDLVNAFKQYFEAQKWYPPHKRPDLYPDLHFKLCTTSFELAISPVRPRVDRIADQKRGMDYLNQVLTRDPTNKEALEYMVNIYWPRIQMRVAQMDEERRVGQVLYANDDSAVNVEQFLEQCDRLINALPEGVERKPEDGEPYFRRGTTYRMLLDQDMENAQRAMADFEAALACDPNNIDWWLSGKLALLEQVAMRDQGRDLSEAQAACEEAIALNEDAARLYLRLYELKALQGDEEGLRELLEIAVEKAPDDGMTYLYLGRYLLFHENMLSAVEVFQTGIDNAPDTLVLYEQLSEVNTHIQEFGAAVAALEAGNAEIDKEIDELVAAGDDDRETESRIRFAEGQRLRMTQNVCNAILNELVHRGSFTYDERRRLNQLSVAVAQLGADDVATRLSVIAADKVITEEDKEAILAFLAEGVLPESDRDYLQFIVDTKLTPTEKDARLVRIAEHQEYIEARRGNNFFEEAQYEGILGRLAWYNGDIDLAKEHLEQANALSGKFDPILKTLLMDIYRNENNRTAEEMIVDEFLAHRLYRTHPHYIYRKADLLFRYNDLEGASRLVAQLIETYPNYEPGIQLAQRIAVATGQIDPGSLSEDMPLSPTLLSSLMARAEEKWNAGYREEALRDAETLFDRAPHNSTIGRRLAQMYVLMDRLEDGVAVMQSLAARYPDNEQLAFEAELIAERSAERRREMQAEYMASLEDTFDRSVMGANMAVYDGDYDAAVEYLKAAVAIDPMRSNVLPRLFDLALEQQDWEDAEWALAIAQERNIDGVNGLLYQATMAAKRAEAALADDQPDPARRSEEFYNQAAGYLEQAIDMDPQNLMLRTRLGFLYQEQGRLQEARQVFDGIIRQDRGYAPAHIGLLRVAIAMNDRGLWSDAVKSAYNLAPNDPFVRNQWLLYMEDLGQGDEQSVMQLIRDRRAVFQANPRDLENAFRLGRLYERVGELEEAERLFRHVYDNSPNRTFGAGVLMSFYDRINELSQIHQIVAERLEDAADDRERAYIYILQGQILGTRDLAMGINAFDQAIRLDPTDTSGYDAKAALQARHLQWAAATDTLRDCLAALEAQDYSEQNELKKLSATKYIARYLIEEGDLQGAEDIIRSIRVRNPEDVEGVVLEGVLQAKNGDTEAALDTLTQAITMDSEHVTAWAERAKIRLGKGEFHLASEDLKRAQSLARDSHNIAFELALSYQQIGELQNAKRGYLAIIEEDPSFEPAVRGLLALYFAEQDWTRYLGLVQDARRRFQTPYYYLAEADMWEERGVTDKRIQALEDALDAKGGRNDRIAVLRLLSALIEFGRDEEARKVCANYVNKEGFREWIPAIVGLLDVRAGDTESANANFAFAVENADEGALSLVAGQVVAAYGLEDGSNKLLLWAQNRGQADGTGDWQIYTIIAVIDTDAGEYDRALELLEKALPLATTDEERGSVLHIMGQAYYAKGDYVNSAASYERALEYNPIAVTRNNLAYVYVDKLDDPESALPHAEQAAELQPMSPEVLDTLGWTLAKLKRYDLAVRYFNKALNLTPLPVTRYHLAYTFERTGRVSEAQQQAQAALLMLQNASDPALGQQVRELLDRLNSN